MRGPNAYQNLLVWPAAWEEANKMINTRMQHGGCENQQH